ncbi:3-oxoacyl-[acyl-carrier protein] reductase [Austwickia chelonae]|uniref:Putative oxidoreductase n=1 Tax=Austwickia chelonae NBRC 105200 TaxID=1184607 RepID=K6VPC3_9MICO|nr:SDR family oxidoreductase [Austwickia chelonae]GAB77220.1 putative oxidoreductase [Austwickia chelonae NBRC 105200]SEW05441.1 3-oxoacyl-[acyl-carrier protein] reductase [Austwickia chelonae]
MSRRFSDRVALVTGASRGIGLAIAHRLVNEGAKVCLTARGQEQLEIAIHELGGPEHALGVAGRADDPDHHQHTVDTILDRWGRLDHLVNNAGINPAYGPLTQLDPRAARKLLDVNILGTLGWIQHTHRCWMAEHGGSIVNIASIAGIRPAPGIAMYGASKSAVIHLTEEFALELAPTTRVNAVAPGVVKTHFAEALYRDKEEHLSAHYPLGRLGEPRDISGAVAFLLSDDATWITGHTIVIDGGLTLRGGE